MATSQSSRPGDVEGIELVLSATGYLTAQAHGAGKGHGWFVARDALIAARLLHPFRPEILDATARYAARSQATDRDPVWDRWPGRIPHEVIEAGVWEQPTYLGLPVAAGSEVISYQSADSTGEWLTALALGSSLSPELARDLESNWAAAGSYLVHQLGIGAGLVRWGPRAWPGTGLEAQGPRDERNLYLADGPLVHPLAAPPRPPVADWETQAASLVGLRALARLSGDADHRNAALAFEARLNSIVEASTVAVDMFDRPVVVRGSAVAALLWAGALSDDKAATVADHLLEPDIYTGFGLRTIAEGEPGYDPINTRRGRIYPYSSYQGACGLRAMGLLQEADRLLDGIATAIDRLGTWPESWAVVDGKLSATGHSGSAVTIAVRAAIEHGHLDTAAGLCESLLRRA